MKMGKNWLSDTWESLTEQFANGTCDNTIDSVLSRIVIATAVYYIWKERNTRMFTGEELDNQVLWSLIVEKIRIQLMCLKVKRSTQVLKIAKEWEVDMNIAVQCLMNGTVSA